MPNLGLYGYTEKLQDFGSFCSVNFALVLLQRHTAVQQSGNVLHLQLSVFKE